MDQNTIKRFPSNIRFSVSITLKISIKNNLRRTMRKQFTTPILFVLLNLTLPIILSAQTQELVPQRILVLKPVLQTADTNEINMIAELIPDQIWNALFQTEQFDMIPIGQYPVSNRSAFDILEDKQELQQNNIDVVVFPIIENENETILTIKSFSIREPGNDLTLQESIIVEEDWLGQINDLSEQMSQLMLENYPPFEPEVNVEEVVHQRIVEREITESGDHSQYDPIERNIMGISEEEYLTIFEEDEQFKLNYFEEMKKSRVGPIIYASIPFFHLLGLHFYLTDAWIRGGVTTGIWGIGSIALLAALISEIDLSLTGKDDDNTFQITFISTMAVWGAWWIYGIIYSAVETYPYNADINERKTALQQYYNGELDESTMMNYSFGLFPLEDGVGLNFAYRF